MVCDSRGVISAWTAGPAAAQAPAGRARPTRAACTGTLADALAGADVFVGVSGGQVPEAAIARDGAATAIVFALANPDPEVHPDVARRYAAVVATGRRDFPNQINNVLAFPGVFRGALDARATAVTEAMKLAAAQAIADLVVEPTADGIVPSVFDEGVAEAVAAAVRALAPSSGHRDRPTSA